MTVHSSLYAVRYALLGSCFSPLVRAYWIFFLIARCSLFSTCCSLLAAKLSLLTVRYSIYAFSFSLPGDRRTLALGLLLLIAFSLTPASRFSCLRFSLLNVCCKRYCITLLTFCLWELSTRSAYVNQGRIKYISKQKALPPIFFVYVASIRIKNALF